MHMMMNDFGVPMNDAEMNMLPPGANKPHERMMAESGMEMQLIPVVAGALLGGLGGAAIAGTTIAGIGIGTAAAGYGAAIGGLAGLGVAGHNRSMAAAKSAADKQNEATDRQLAFDTQLWEMDKEKIVADRNHAVNEINLRAYNENKVAAYKDATNLQKYQYDMMIRNREQNSLNQQFLRSDDIYHKQTTLNNLTANSGQLDELRKLQEIRAEASFEQQEAQVEQIIQEGKMRARGVSGRTARKIGQATIFDLGRRTAMINESLAGAMRNTRSVLKEIARDKASADLAAYANKMLDPGVLPEPIRPFATPQATFLYPREIGEYDFGPRPVAGAYASRSAATNQVWGSTLSGIAGMATSVAGLL